MGAEMVVIGDLSEHSLVGVVSNLLKNRFSSVADLRSPCTLGAGLLQPAIRFIPFHTSFGLFCPILASIFSL